MSSSVCSRKDGQNKLIRIYHRCGVFDFVENSTKNFTSVGQLIRYYQNNSLDEYNTTLDIKLTNPVSKRHRLDLFCSPDLTPEELLEQLQEKDAQLRANAERFEKVDQEYRTKSQELNESKIILKAYESTIQLLLDHDKFVTSAVSSSEDEEMQKK